MEAKQFPHIKLKFTKEVKLDFKMSELVNNITLPKSNEVFSKDYKNSKKLSDDYDKDLIIALDDRVIFGFDYAYNGDKIIIPEIIPTTIFYSNAIMSHFKIQAFKEKLLKESPSLVRQAPPQTLLYLETSSALRQIAL